jgi:hypothetical protein
MYARVDWPWYREPVVLKGDLYQGNEKPTGLWILSRNVS